MFVFNILYETVGFLCTVSGKDEGINSLCDCPSLLYELTRVLLNKCFLKRGYIILL